MKAWDIPGMDVEPQHPQVLDSEAEGRLIVIQLLAGERMQEHQVHERAWLAIVSGTVTISDSDGETLVAGPGALAEFNPNERREIEASEDARLLMLLAPWPGEGHPRNG